MRSSLRTIYLNIALTCVLLVGLEGFGQGLYYLLHGRFVFSPRPVEEASPFAELHPFLVGRLRAGARFEHGGKLLTTTSSHTRSTGAPTDSCAIAIAVFGGSSTLGWGVTDADTWPALLQRELGPGYAVTNFGMNGYGSAEAIIQTALLAHELNPYVVVYYEGWNDIKNYHDEAFTADYYSHGKQQYQNLQIRRPDDSRIDLARASALVLGTRLLSAKIRKPDQPPPPRTRNDHDPRVDAAYHRNLRTLRVLAQGMDAAVLFVPQVFNDSAVIGDRTSNQWTPRIDNAALPGLMRRFNGIMGDVCAGATTGCDVATDIASAGWRREDFFDEGHLRPVGARRLAVNLAPRVKELSAGRAKLLERRKPKGCSADG